MKNIEKKVNKILEARGGPVGGGTARYVDVWDVNTNRKSSFGIYDDKPGVLRVVGNLEHNSEITFKKKDAALLIKELRKIK